MKYLSVEDLKSLFMVSNLYVCSLKFMTIHYIFNISVDEHPHTDLILQSLTNLRVSIGAKTALGKL